MTGALRYVRCGIFLMMLFACAYNLTGASASSDSTPEWIPSENSVMVTADAELAAASLCVNQKIDVVTWRPGPTDPYAQSADACVVSNGDVDIATTYTLENGYRHGVAVKLAGDAYYRHISISQNAVKVSGNGDAVAYLDYDSVGNVTKLTTVSDLLHSIEPEAFDAVGNAQSYQLKPTAKRAWMERSSGSNSYHNTYTYAISDNGRYVAAYVDYLGIVKIDLQSGSVERALYSPGAWYSPLNNPTPMAITDDGRYILTAPDLRVIDTVSCTQPFGNGFDPYQPDHCPTRALAQQVSDVIGYTFHLSAARFTDDNYSIEAATTLFPGTQPTQGDGSPRHVKVSLGGYDDGRLQYLALGDSYSSGEGDVDDNGFWYKLGTENRDECHLSTRSYPYLLKEKWNIADNSMQSIACSGAKVDNDYVGVNEYFGQHGNLKGKTEIEKQNIRTNALNSFAPGIVRQIDFVTKYKPETLTLTAGGNDVGFGEILGYCAKPKASLIDIPCAQAYDLQVAANLRKTIDEERGPLTTLVQDIKEASPETRIYLVGYPQFVSLEGCALDSKILDISERLMIRSSVSRFNNVLKLVARDTDIYYVNIEDSLDGGQICQGSRYMTGPVKIATKVVSGYMQEAYHPNAAGHKRIADVIDEQIRTNNLSYTIIDIPLEQSGQRVVKKAITSSYAGIGSTQTMEMGPGIFRPDGTVDGVIFSKKTHLGDYKVAHDGSLNAKITIPSDMEVGNHLLTLTGQSVDGDIVQIQQYITVYDDRPIDQNGLNIQSRIKLPDNEDSHMRTVATDGIDDWYNFNKNEGSRSSTDSELTNLDQLGSISGSQSSRMRLKNVSPYTIGLISAIIILLIVGIIYAKRVSKKET